MRRVGRLGALTLLAGVAALATASAAAGATGELAYEDCITGETQSGPGGSGACAAIGSATSGGVNSGLDTPTDAVVSPDGKSLYIAAPFDDAVGRFSRNPATGELAYEDCITGETESGPGGTGACAAIAPGLVSGALALSPDGESLYAGGGSTVARFTRDPANGELTYEGSISPSLDSLNSVAVSPDGKSLYAAYSGNAAVARFTRDPATGKLAYKDCITGETESGPGGTGACAAIPSASLEGNNSGLGFPSELAVNPDGESLYVTSLRDDAVARFSRDPATGELTYEDCITGKARAGPSGSGACAAIASARSTGEGSGLDGLSSVAVSPDGASVYAASFGFGRTVEFSGDDAVSRFSRDPATGELAYEGCITGKTEYGPSGSGVCAAIGSATSIGRNSGLDGPSDLAVNPDGESLYAVSRHDDAVARFSRDPATGELAYEDCITGETESGPSGTGACAAIPSATPTEGTGDGLSGGHDSGLDGPSSVAVSPDGRSVYSTSIGFDSSDSPRPGPPGDDAVAHFSRAGLARVLGRALTVDAAPGVANRIAVKSSNSDWVVRDAAAPLTAGPSCAQLTPDRVRCPQAAVNRLVVDTGDLNDRVSTPSGLNASVFAGDGNDTATTGDGADKLAGQQGNDKLDGGAGPDILNGGHGNRDIATFGLRGAAQPVDVSLDDVANDGGAIDGGADNVRASVENVIGGAGADTLTGSELANTLTGGAGADELHGLGANDAIHARGDGSDDTITCGAGPMDHVFADPGDAFPVAGPDACELVN